MPELQEPHELETCSLKPASTTTFLTTCGIASMPSFQVRYHIEVVAEPKSSQVPVAHHETIVDHGEMAKPPIVCLC